MSDLGLNDVSGNDFSAHHPPADYLPCSKTPIVSYGFKKRRALVRHHRTLAPMVVSRGAVGVNGGKGRLSLLAPVSSAFDSTGLHTQANAPTPLMLLYPNLSSSRDDLLVRSAGRETSRRLPIKVRDPKA